MLKLIEAIFCGKIKTEEINTVGSEQFRGELNCNTAQCDKCGKCLSICPVAAIKINEYNRPAIDYKRCVFCGRCVEACTDGALYHSNLEALPEKMVTSSVDIGRVVNKKNGISLHVRHLDAGSCNACDFEMGALANPIYDLHRFGISFVASHRHADVVMVTGVV
ncbi:MAG: 4Fe-4S dicluster domain-containing protein, partial [Acidaminococcaceae bacterium]